jgi:3-chloro-4-hydroxyphenylacetate reductive dehalogenase
MSAYHNHSPLGSFPMHKLKRVDRPTNFIDEKAIQRRSESEAGFARAMHGDFGPTIRREVARFAVKHPLSASMLEIENHLSEKVDGVVASQKAPITQDPEALALHIKKTAYFLRADSVGICELPPYAVYTSQDKAGSAPWEAAKSEEQAEAGQTPEVPASLGADDDLVASKHTHAIAVLVDQDYPASHATNGHDWISNSMSFVAYTGSALIATMLAGYIRRLGYSARAHAVGDYQVMVTPILLWAGQGEMCRIGDIVLHPFLGPRFKASVVTTDMPMLPDKPIDFGLQDFCMKCKKCARECPSHALGLEGKVLHNGYEKWPVDVRKCTSMRVGNMQGTSCGTCLTVCPWNKPYTPFHRSVGWAMRHSSLARSAAIWGDDLLGYGKAHPKERWWFDLEERDGVVGIPGPKRKRVLVSEDVEADMRE